MLRHFPSTSNSDPRYRRMGEQGRERARAVESHLNAYVAFREMTPASDGVLAGLPYAAKDIFFTPDRWPFGGLTHRLPLADCDYADALRLLDEAGADRIGYTGLTEIAYEPSGYNAVCGRVRNPWDFDFVSGGSSSGSAAAVASGSVVIALGSDTGGSLRIPAHACGITAWKPTYGAVPVSGAMPLAPTLDTVGLLARGAAEILLAASVIANLKKPTPIHSGVVLRDTLDVTDRSVGKACQDGIDAIASCGVALDWRDGLAAIDAAEGPVFTLMQGEAARCHRGLLEDDTVGPTLRRRLAKGLEIDDAALLQAAAQRGVLAAAFVHEILRAADIAILPVMPIRTPPAAECDPANAKFRPRTLYELSRLTRFANMLGFPAVAFPVGFDDRGLPVGLQIVGRPDSDHDLIALAAAVQVRSDWHGRIPDAIAPHLPATGTA